MMEHHERCATWIDHALRCTCEREAAYDERIREAQEANYGPGTRWGRNIWWRTARHRGYRIEHTTTQKAFVAIDNQGERRRVFWHGDETKTACRWLCDQADNNQQTKEA